jgi:membrane protein YdbS with pleckstrin-like domain
MGYPDKLLNPGERVAVDVVPHWKFLALPALAVAVVLAGAIVALQFQLPRWAYLAIAGVMVVCLLWLVRRYLRWVTTSFVVTNQRLIMRKGVFRRSGREILIDRLTDITYKQTLTDRLLRSGDILLESPGRQGQEVLKDLPRPIKIQNEICRLVSQRDGIQGQSAGWQAPGSYTVQRAGAGAAGARPAASAPAGAAPAPSGSPASAIAPGSGTGSGRVHVGPAPSEVTTGSLSEPTVAEQLSQLDDLRRRGVISRREFAAKKSELLSRM